MRQNGDSTFGPKTFRQPTEKFIERKGLYLHKYLLQNKNHSAHCVCVLSYNIKDLCQASMES